MSEAGLPVAAIMQSLTKSDQAAATLVASEAGAPVGAKQLSMQSLARSGQAEATLESEAGAPVTSIMQSLT